MKNIMKLKKILKEYSSWKPNKYIVILILMFPFLLFILKDFKVDNDFWFLINTGREILNNGFITIEPFTIHTGLSFIPQQWLTDIIFYKIYSIFGICGMYILLILLTILITYLMYNICYLITSKVKTSMFITFIINVLLIRLFITTRPQTFDIIIFLSELFLLEKYIKTSTKKIFLLVPLSLLLINLHSSMWMMLFVFLLPYYAEYIINLILKKENFSIKYLVITTILCFLVGFINPYGIDNILYLFNSFGVSYINEIIYEMMPLNIKDHYMAFIFMFVVLISFIIGKKNFKFRYLFLFLGTTLLSLMHFKGLIYLFISSPLILSSNFKHIFSNESKEEVESNMVVIIFTYIVFIIFIIFNTSFDESYPIEEFADYLDKYASKDIILYTGYNIGGYMEYRGYKCYIDPRAEVFLKSNNKKEDIFVEYYNLSRNKLDVNAFINKYNFDYIITEEKDSIYENMPDNYMIVYSKIVDDNTYYLLKKNG